MKIGFIIGAVSIIAAGIYVASKLFVRKSTNIADDVSCEQPREENAENSSSEELTRNDTTKQDGNLSAIDSLENEMNKTKASTVQSISERHKEAADIIRESAINILNSSSEDEEKLNQIFDDLNNM